MPLQNGFRREFISYNLHVPEATKSLFSKFSDTFFLWRRSLFGISCIEEASYEMMRIYKIRIEKRVYSVDEKSTTVKVLRILYYRREWHAFI